MGEWAAGHDQRRPVRLGILRLLLLFDFFPFEILRFFLLALFLT